MSIVTNIQQAQEVINALEENLKSITDRIDMLDPLIQGKSHMYFRCLHSGKYYPSDFIKEWGKKYGIGLGGDPRSECLDSDYDTTPSLDNIISLEQIMHPCKVSGAPLDVVFLSKEAPKSDLLIPAYIDKRGKERGKIMRLNQLKNPRNRIKAIMAKAGINPEVE